jgi:hypothetical protein
MVTASLNIPIYGNRLHIIITEDFISDIVEINKSFNQEFTEKDAVLGLSQQRGGHTLIIINVGRHKKIFKKIFEIEIIGTITHEAVHACNTIFNQKGIKLDVDNDEPQAYFIEYITKEIYKLYIKHTLNESTN